MTVHIQTAHAGTDLQRMQSLKRTLADIFDDSTSSEMTGCPNMTGEIYSYISRCENGRAEKNMDQWDASKTCKNYFWDCSAALAQNVGHIGRVNNKTNQFALQDCANRRLIIGNEISMEEGAKEDF
ncbi:hypothetical protein CDAR_270231 [Caerostris darwini]|uniref:Uncharacterized protein n=1 Tax=Caerostris darwini TaxID=1538125 RepID=A0AAV4NI29_9ARAC|nr:hypothetical protein CDAR_270231 [Caerostris darwini]